MNERLPTVPQVPRPPLSKDDQVALAASMRRHPAGKARSLSECPTCGQNVSGALGTPQEVLI